MLVCGIDASSTKWCDYIFVMCYTHLKLTLLLHITVLVNFPIGTSVLALYCDNFATNQRGGGARKKLVTMYFSKVKAGSVM